MMTIYVWTKWLAIGLIVVCLFWLITRPRIQRWFINRPWGLFIKPIAKHAWEEIKRSVTKHPQKRKVEILVKDLTKRSSRKWLFISLGILVAFFGLAWFPACKVLSNTTLKISGWHTWFGVLFIFSVAILVVLIIVRMMPTPTDNAGEESTKFKFPKINWEKLSDFLKVVISCLAVVWLCWYGIPSCVKSCNEPKVHVPKRILTEGRFEWWQRADSMIGKQQNPDQGYCDARIEVNDSNVWKIVMHDNKRRVGHYIWWKTNSCGTWSQECPPEGGTWKLEKVSHNVYVGEMTGTRYPNQTLDTKLTLRR